MSLPIFLNDVPRLGLPTCRLTLSYGSYTTAVRVLNTSLTCILFIHYSSAGFNTSLTYTFFIHYSSAGFEYVLDLYIVHTLHQCGF